MKVGDRVQIKKSLRDSEEGSPDGGWYGNMKEGEVGVLVEIGDRRRKPIDVEIRFSSFSDGQIPWSGSLKDIELAVEEKKEGTMQAPGTALVAINESITVWEKMVLSGGGMGDKGDVCRELFGTYPHYCPLCAYSGKKVTNQECNACPYMQEYGRCEERGKPYHSWKDAGSTASRRKWALAFLEQLHALKVIEEKRPTCPFKVGDMVRVKDKIKNPTDSWGPVKKGDVGKVVEIDNKDYMTVNFDAHHTWSASIKEMELAPVPTSKPKYEVGDVLRCASKDYTVERVTCGVHLDHQHWHYHMVGVGTPKDESHLAPAPKMVDEERWVDITSSVEISKYGITDGLIAKMTYAGDIVAKLSFGGVAEVKTGFKVENNRTGKTFKGWVQIFKREVVQVEAKSKTPSKSKVAPKGWGKTTRR